MGGFEVPCLVQEGRRGNAGDAGDAGDDAGDDEPPADHADAGTVPAPADATVLPTSVRRVRAFADVTDVPKGKTG